MPIVCGVRFRGTGKVYYFDPGDQDLLADDHVIVETARGVELGQVAIPRQEVDQSDVVGELKPVLRRATTADLLDGQLYEAKETEACETCKEQVTKFDLPMKVVSAEYSFDGSRLTFFFTAGQRVDFRQLVRELARVFRTRIELRQIGVRDEARIVGGLGKCGRALCCKTWLNGFSPVSIRMAKQQDLPLSPMEISGLCGRLLCCLGYEHDYYKDIKSHFPRVGKRIDTPEGQGKVVRVSVLREMVTVLYEDGSELDFTAEQLSRGERSAEPRGEGLSDAQREALDTALQRTERGGSGDRQGAARRPPDEGDRQGPAGGEERRSGRRRRKPRGSGAPEQAQGGDNSGGQARNRASDRGGSRRSRRRPGGRRSSEGSQESEQAQSRSRKRSGQDNDAEANAGAQGGQQGGRRRRPRGQSREQRSGSPGQDGE